MASVLARASCQDLRSHVERKDEDAGDPAVDRLVDGLDAPGFDARELQQGVDELQESQGVAVEEIDGDVIDG